MRLMYLLNDRENFWNNISREFAAYKTTLYAGLAAVSTWAAAIYININL